MGIHCTGFYRGHIRSLLGTSKSRAYRVSVLRARDLGILEANES